MYPSLTKPQVIRSHGIAFVAEDFHEGFSGFSWDGAKVTKVKNPAAGSNVFVVGKAIQSCETIPSCFLRFQSSTNVKHVASLPYASSSSSSSSSSSFPVSTAPCSPSSLAASISPRSSPSSSFSSFSSTKSPSNVPLSPSDVLFATRLFEVRPSSKSGFGAFALVDIPGDAIVHSETPLFQTTAVQLYYAYEQLSMPQMTEYFSLACWRGASLSKVMAIFMTNRFKTSGDLSGIFLKSSRFNHACSPVATCTYRWEGESNLMVFTAMTSIKTGEEITVPYCSDPQTLYQNYGFRCDCSCCQDVIAKKSKGKHILYNHIFRELD